MKKLYVFLIILALLPTFANAAKPKDVPEDLYVKEQVERFFKTTVTLQADFTQIDSQGNVSGGKFLLKRPGKFRWEYDKRQPLLIISNGDRLVYRDKELDETTYVSAEDTLASFLARDEVRLEGDITLHEAFIDGDYMKVIISLTDKPDDGKLAFYFDTKDMNLLAMDVIDSADYKTKIKFTHQVYGQEIANNNFIYQDPKLKKNIWEKK